MVSSHYSHRRGKIPRPKVCRPSPPPPVTAEEWPTNFPREATVSVNYLNYYTYCYWAWNFQIQRNTTPRVYTGAKDDAGNVITLIWTVAPDQMSATARFYFAPQCDSPWTYDVDVSNTSYPPGWEFVHSNAPPPYNLYITINQPQY